MGRRAHISGEDLVGAAARVCARLGLSRASIDAIAREAGVPVGSVYHRVDSRAALLAEVWIAAAQAFGAEFFEHLSRAESLDSAAEVALVTPRFTRKNHTGAVALFAYRRDDFLDGAPAQARERAARLSSDLQKGIGDAARRLLPEDKRGREKMAVALLGVPYGAVRIFLPQATPPAELDPVIVAAARAALGVTAGAGAPRPGSRHFSVSASGAAAPLRARDACAGAADAAPQSHASRDPPRSARMYRIA